jgi:hypothetical protein
MTKKQLREARRAEKETQAEGRDVRPASDERPVVGSRPDMLADQRDDDIPVETRRELMQCATSNGRISYWYLCDIWRRGKRAGLPQLHTEIALLLNRLVLASLAKGAQEQLDIPKEDRITDADIDKIEWQILDLVKDGCRWLEGRDVSTLVELVQNLQVHAREHGWQDVDEPIAALLTWKLA